MARLILDTAQGRREVPVAGTAVLGRAPTVAVPLEDSKLSREHCSVSFDGRRYVLEDLASRNGTYLNGDRVVSVSALFGGDQIKIGTTTILFQLDPGDPGQGQARPAPVAMKPATGAVHPHPAGHKTAATAAAGPGFVTRLFGWILLLGILAGTTYGLKLAFAWALGRMKP